MCFSCSCCCSFFVENPNYLLDDERCYAYTSSCTHAHAYVTSVQHIHVFIAFSNRGMKIVLHIFILAARAAVAFSSVRLFSISSRALWLGELDITSISLSLKPKKRQTERETEKCKLTKHLHRQREFLSHRIYSTF